MQWQKRSDALISISTTTDQKFSRVYFINIDCGLTWNPSGRNKCYPGDWVWSHPDKTYIIDYINSLSDIEWLEDTGESRQGVCVFFTSESKTSETKIVCQEISQDINEVNWIIGVKPSKALEIVNTLFDLSNCQITSTPYLCDDMIPYDIWELKLSPEFTFPDPVPHSIGIIIGQPGCGKSSYCKHLQTLGYIIIDEIECAKIRKGTKKSVSNFKTLIGRVKKCSESCECKNSCTNYGIILDSTNPTVEGRALYSAIADEFDIECINLWLSQPGYYNNSRRNEPLSKTALNMYTGRLVLPETYIRVL